MSYAGMGPAIEPCDVRSCDSYGVPVDSMYHSHRTTRHVDNGAGYCAGPGCVQGQHSTVLSRHCPVQNTPEQIHAHRVADAHAVIARAEGRVADLRAELATAIDVHSDAVYALEKVESPSAVQP